MELFIILLLIVVFIFVARNMEKKRKEKEEDIKRKARAEVWTKQSEEMKMRETELQDFKVTKKCWMDDSRINRILLDEENKKFAVMEYGKKNEIFQGKDIIDIKIEEVSETFDLINSHNRDTVMMKNFTTGGFKSNKGIKKVEVVVSLNAPSRPLIKVNIFDDTFWAPSNSERVVRAFEEAKDIEARFKGIHMSSQPENLIHNNLSDSDQILKLYDLNQQGIISDEEFVKAKKKILA